MINTKKDLRLYKRKLFFKKIKDFLFRKNKAAGLFVRQTGKNISFAYTDIRLDDSWKYSLSMQKVSGYNIL